MKRLLCSAFGFAFESKLSQNKHRQKQVKKQVKNVIEKSNLVFNSNTDYVIIIKKEINEIKYSEIKKNLMDLLKKVTD